MPRCQISIEHAECNVAKWHFWVQNDMYDDLLNIIHSHLTRHWWDWIRRSGVKDLKLFVIFHSGPKKAELGFVESGICWNEFDEQYFFHL